MNVELINTGTELMLGQVLNSHLGIISQELAGIGWRVERQVTVPDGGIIHEVLKEAMERTEVVIMTGGLGPTSDDLTRDVVSELFSVPLYEDKKILEDILNKFKRLGLEAPERTHVQALVPEGAEVLPNKEGTAPGLYLKKNGIHLFCLPGPTHEMLEVLRKGVLPKLEALGMGVSVYTEIFRITEVGEISVQEKIEPSLRKFEGLEIAYRGGFREVDLRITTKNREDFEKASECVKSAFADSIYATGMKDLEEVVIELARERGKKIVTAESCTGGLVAHRLTNVPGASDVLEKGWVVYSNKAKENELGVLEATLKKYGAVSEEVAVEMAKGALEKSSANVSVALTGIAGPSGGSEKKPVGLAFIAWGVREGEGVKVHCGEYHFVTKRDVFKKMASQTALNGLRKELLRSFK